MLQRLAGRLRRMLRPLHGDMRTGGHVPGTTGDARRAVPATDARSSAHWLALLEEFGGTNGEGREYFLAHFERYVATLGFMRTPRDRRARVLELGASYPFAFTLMLRELFPMAEIELAQLNDDPAASAIELRSHRTGRSLRFPVHSFNVERDTWPFETGSVDCVLCMEIVEHLLLDPMHVFREAHRVLRVGGEFLVTTPNIASYAGLDNLIRLRSPYSFGVYSKHGAYGRHNREFAPREVGLLGERSGFETAALTTADVYPRSCDYGAVRAAFTHPLGQDELRRQNIFYRGVKAQRPFGAYPPELFDFDPGVHRASIAIPSMSPSVAPGERIAGHAALGNTGGYLWRRDGDDMTRLRAMLLDRDRRLIAKDFRKIALPRDVGPGERVEFDFELQGHPECGEYFLRFDMVHERVCWFSDLKPSFVDVPVRIVAPDGSRSTG